MARRVGPVEQRAEIPFRLSLWRLAEQVAPPLDTCGLRAKKPRHFCCRFLLATPRKQPVALSVIEKRPIITSKAGMMAVAYIQRQAPISGMFLRTR